MTRPPHLRITEAPANRSAGRAGPPPQVEKGNIMQVRSLFAVAAAALLSVAALGASAQEIDRSETLAARNLASQRDAASRSRVAVLAEVRNLQAQHQLQVVGERAEAPEVGAAAAPVVARGLTRAEVKADLAQWRSAHPQAVGERG